MRYDKDHKQATRQRIVEAAGRRFKQDGIDGAGVAAVMSDAGLTNGAFYHHFASKEDLVANVLADQLRAQRHSFDAQPHDRAGLEAIIRAYLSPEHRDQCADGCPSAALLDEIDRRPAASTMRCLVAGFWCLPYRIANLSRRTALDRAVGAAARGPTPRPANGWALLAFQILHYSRNIVL